MKYFNSSLESNSASKIKDKQGNVFDSHTNHIVDKAKTKQLLLLNKLGETDKRHSKNCVAKSIKTFTKFYK